MKYYYYESSIDTQYVEKLIEFLNTNTWPITIYFASEGWCNSGWQTLLNVLNSEKERITLIAIGKLMSTAFDIFFSFEWKKSIEYSVLGMYHQSTVDISINVKWNPVFQSDKAFKLWVASYLDHTKEICRISGMNKSEIQKWNKWDDVYFINTRMKEMLDYNLRIKNIWHYQVFE